MAPSLTTSPAIGITSDFPTKKSSTNQSVVWVAPAKAETVHRDIPELGEEDVLIKVIVTGICGSDAHVWESNHAKIPPVLGHESAGVIMQVGSKVTDRAVGQRVAIEPGFPCMKLVLSAESVLDFERTAGPDNSV
ncbi:putative D-xylulose reductase A [Lachnellula occidentalis]|uniref:D-xylulose reductase n=1 Tax=Lachnellula occidentalis TaxID=215460 RepID=A0A8H8RHP5_9HELO|nr:putative D-xylulose reductase A [Lachnellula occidentalis]